MIFPAYMPDIYRATVTSTTARQGGAVPSVLAVRGQGLATRDCVLVAEA
jgi:hypothetical protein